MKIASLLLACGLSLGTAAHAQSQETYDGNTAMNLAGQQVPENVESYYFFVFDSVARLAPDTAELTGALVKAASAQEFLGIIGPDASRNRKALETALAGNRGNSLSGLTLIYLGPVEHAEPLRLAIAATGAQLRYVVYPREKAF